MRIEGEKRELDCEIERVEVGGGGGDREKAKERGGETARYREQQDKHAERN